MKNKVEALSDIYDCSSAISGMSDCYILGGYFYE
jgi:hypothetical protein